MKKLFLFIQASFLYPLLAFPAFAQTEVDPCVGVGPGKEVNPFLDVLCAIGGNQTSKTLGNIVIAIIVIAVVIALLYLLYGGVKWITSRGEKDQVEAARNHIIAAVVGLIVVFLAIFIVSLVLAAFDLSLTDLKIPKIVAPTS
ncbi:MAG: hypothetical protein HYT07_03555 [Candidatus Levybacteria bacterium]|nr:hypothetical protein [Candidatus Levybacteria bacterium]